MDEDVASAVAHWAPRFTTNGVTVSDFQQITAGLEHWSQWCQAWSAVAAEHAALGRAAADQGRLLSAADHFAQAAVYYHFAKFVFVDDLQQMRSAHGQAVACMQLALPHLVPAGRRIEIPFESVQLVGVLRRPAGAGPHPTVVLLSGLDSAKEELRTTEDTFLARGLATFSVDGPGQGESEYAFPIRADWSAPAAAILDVLGAQPDVDTSRLGVWGVSLGGYYSVRVAAALGDRISACVALSGPFDFGACWRDLPRLTRRTFEVRSWAQSEQEAGDIANTLTLKDTLGTVTASLLVVAGRKDRLFPWQQAEQIVAAANCDVELLMLEDGGHGCANVAPWHRPYTADWMAAKLCAHPLADPSVPLKRPDQQRLDELRKQTIVRGGVR